MRLAMSLHARSSTTPSVVRALEVLMERDASDTGEVCRSISLRYVSAVYAMFHLFLPSFACSNLSNHSHILGFSI